MNKTLEAGFIFTGTIIGAGVLGLPYIIEKSGFLVGMIELIFIGIITLLVSLMLGEVSLKTKKPHQISGLAEKYIGKWAKHLATLLCAGFVYGAMIAYVYGCGSIISIFGIDPLLSKLLFFIPFASIAYFGVKGIEKGESFFVPLIVICTIAISIAALFNFVSANIVKTELSNFFAPLGVILFAYAGVFAIPQMKEVLWNEKKNLKKSIYIGLIISFFLYAFFVFSCIGALGGEISEVATISLGEQHGAFFFIFGNLFAFFAMATGFIALGNSLRETYNQDYKINNNLSFILAIFPSLFALGDFSTFTQVLSLAGSLFFTPLLILIVYLYYKTKKGGERKPEYEMKLPNWLLWLVSLILLFIMIFVSWQGIIGTLLL